MISNKPKIRKEGKFQSIFIQFLIGILFLAVVVFFINSNFRLIQKRGDMNNQISDLEDEIALLQDAKDRFEQGLMDTEEAAYWEERLREQGYKKPGEETVVVLPSEESNAEEEVETKSFWDRLKSFFGL